MPSNKRRKLDLESPENIESLTYHPDVLAEVDLEIGIRERLAETLRSRIAWALTLQEALGQESSSGAVSSTSFEQAALDALSAIEAGTEFLFNRDIPAPPHSPRPVAKVPRAPPKPKFINSRNPGSFLYIRASGLGSSAAEEDGQMHDYFLRCPVCDRSAFTSLQGLLNHGRITHKLEWGTHDACVRACAVLDPDMDTSKGIQVNSGNGGILPGLRSLFQMAVGSQQPPSAESVPLQPWENGDGVAEESRDAQGGAHLARTLGLHKDTPALAPFLGKQAIRKGIKVSGDENDVVDIDGFDENGAVAVTEAIDIGPSQGGPKRAWRMPFAQRNVREATPDVEVSNALQLTLVSKKASPDTSIGNANTSEASTVSMVADEVATTVPSVTSDRTIAIAPGVASEAGSRFLFTTRVIIADRSLWVPPDRRSADSKDHTHAWMISVDAPSYAHHITTVLQRLTVTGTAITSSQPLSTTDPPFVLVGTTSEPFLARVELTFGGTSSNGRAENRESDGQKVVLEHWVELDPLRSASVTLGEEQIVDIELDRRTTLMPIRTDYPQIGPKLLWEMGKVTNGLVATGKDRRKNKEKARTDTSPAYEQALMGLLAKFPMTLKDCKGGRPPQPPLPYKLVATPAQFKALVCGRRKAIEWARASAIQDAYNRAFNRSTSEQGLIPLTTADIFAWLSERGHFPRPKAQNRPQVVDAAIVKQEDGAPLGGTAVERWCRVCGLGVAMHEAVRGANREVVKQEAVDSVNGDMKYKALGPGHRLQMTALECDVVTSSSHVYKMPMIDVGSILGTPSHALKVAKPVSARWFKEHKLVAAADPKFTLAIRDVVLALKLPAFGAPLAPILDAPSHLSSPVYPLKTLGAASEQVHATLAPHALLALATQRFVKALVQGGLSVAVNDKVQANEAISPDQRRGGRRRKEQDKAKSILTPMHILRNIVGRGRRGNDDLDTAIFACLCRIGIAADIGGTPSALEYAVDDDARPPGTELEGSMYTQAPSEEGVEGEIRVKLEYD